MSEVLTLQQVAEQLHCSPSLVRRHIAVGRLAAIDLGTASHHHYRITRQALDAFLSAPTAVAEKSSVTEPISLNHRRFMKRLG